MRVVMMFLRWIKSVDINFDFAIRKNAPRFLGYKDAVNYVNRKAVFECVEDFDDEGIIMGIRIDRDLDGAIKDYYLLINGRWRPGWRCRPIIK